MLIDDYHIGKKVFEDVIGEIYVASTSDLDKAVYFKILHAHFSDDPELVRLFHRGAEVACSLESDDHIRMITHGHEDGKHYAILENFNLTPLNIFLKQKKVFSLIEATEITERLAEIIRRLHIEDEIYGILAPQNIFVDYDLREFKLANFGFMEFVHRLIETKSDKVEPYLPYCSPEFIKNNKAIDRQSDIFSLGVMFYRLLVGHLPWSSENMDDYLTAMHQHSVIPPSLQRLEIPDYLDNIILDALNPDIEARCPNLSTFIQEVGKAKSSILASLTPTSEILSTTNGERSEAESGSEQITAEHDDVFEEEPEMSGQQFEHDEEAKTEQSELPEAFSGSQPQHSPESEVAVQEQTNLEPSPEIATDDEPTDAGAEQESEPINGVHEQKNIVSIQEYELDDKPTLRLESSGNGKKEDAPAKRQQQSQPQPAPAAQPSASQPAPPPPRNSLPTNIDEAEEYFEETATQTQTLSTTKTANLDRRQIDGNSFLSFAKIALLSLIPILAIYTLVAFTFDLNFSRRIASIFTTDDPTAGTTEMNSGATSNRTTPLNGASTQEQPIKTREMATNESTSSQTDNRANGATRRATEPNTPVNAEPQSRRQPSLQTTTRSGTVPAQVQPTLDIRVRGGQSPLVADIFLNGDFYDRTGRDGRLAISGLRRGSYIVKVERTGYEMWAKEIEYRGSSQRVDVQLQPSGNASQRTDTVPSQRDIQRTNGTSGSGLENQRNSIAAPEPRKIDKDATVTIELTGPEQISEAFIYVNSALWHGEDNIAPAQIELPPGSYTIEVRKEGYRSAPPAYPIDLLAGQNRTVRFILTPN